VKGDQAARSLEAGERRERTVAQQLQIVKLAGRGGVLWSGKGDGIGRVRHAAIVPLASLPGCPGSPRDDDACSDRLVRGLGTQVARGQVCVVLGCGERHERVVDRTAGDPKPTEHVRDAPRYVIAQE